MFLGSGTGGAWTRDDWDYYYENYDGLWSGETEWRNPDSVTGWDLFALHVERLASHYSVDQSDQFMRDFALVFAGISDQGSWAQAAMDAIHGPTERFLIESNEGLDSQYLDTLDPLGNQSHHYAGILFLSYFAGGLPGSVINLARDPDNPGDINLGEEAARNAAYIIGPFWNYSIYDIHTWIDNLSH